MKEEYYKLEYKAERKEKIDNCFKIEDNENIYSNFIKKMKESPKVPIFGFREFDEKTKKLGKLKSYTREDVYEESELIGNGLAELGFKKGDIVYENFFPLKQMLSLMVGIARQGGILSLGGDYYGKEYIEFIKVNPKIVIVERRKIKQAIHNVSLFFKESKEKLNLTNIIVIPSIRDVFFNMDMDIEIAINDLKKSLNDIGAKDVNPISYQSLLDLGKKCKHDIAKVEPNDPCVYGLSSSTSGNNYKIIIKSHKNYIVTGNVLFSYYDYLGLKQIYALGSFYNVHENDYFFNTLSLLQNFYSYYLSNGLESYDEDIKYFEINYIHCVPSFYKYFYDLAIKKIKEGQKEADVIEETKRSLGGKNLKFLTHYGGKISKNTINWYVQKLKVTFSAHYGAGECGLISIGKYNQDCKEGYVGNYMTAKEMKIRKLEEFPFITEFEGYKVIRGELMIGPDNTMNGYYQDEEKTKRAIDKDGFYHTDDAVEYNTKTGELYILDRMKNIINLPNSENVPATFIENSLMGSEYINQAVVYGDMNSCYLTYILTLNIEIIDPSIDLEDKNENHIIHSIKIKEIIQDELEKIYEKNEFFEHFKGKYLILISKKWTAEENLITEVMTKIRRGEVIKKYMNIILNQRDEDKKLEMEPDYEDEKINKYL